MFRVGEDSRPRSYITENYKFEYDFYSKIVEIKPWNVLHGRENNVCG